MRLFHFIVAILLASMFIFLSLLQFSGVSFDYKTIELIVFISVIINVSIMLYYRSDWSSITYLFNATFILFLFSKPFVDLLGYQDALYIDSLVNASLNSEIYNRILTYTAISYFEINAGFVFINDKVSFPGCDYKIYTLGKWLFIFSFPLVVYKYLLEINYLIKYGYLALYTGGLAEINYGNIFVSNAHSIFLSSFFFILASDQKVDKIKIYMYIFMFVSLMDALKGARGLFVLPLFFCFWYLTAKSGKGVRLTKKVKILCCTLLLIIGAQAAVDYRMQRSEQDVSFVETVFSFFYQQGNSLNVVYFSELLKDDLNANNNSVPFVLEPMIFPYLYLTKKNELLQGQTDATVSIRPNLNHRLTHALNEDYYRSGGGMGSSFVAELAIINVIVLIILSGLVPLGVYLLINGMKYRIVLYLSYFFMTHILFLPRASFIPNFWVLSKYIIFFVILYLISKAAWKNDKTSQ